MAVEEHIVLYVQEQLREAGEIHCRFKKERDHRVMQAHEIGLSLRQIAEPLGISHVTVKNIIDRQAREEESDG